MILADKLIDLRKKNGWSQEELAERLGVSRQSISKWESAQSVPDMGRIVQLSELYGVSTDYLLKDEMEPEDRAEALSDDLPSCRSVGMEEANAFLRVKEQNSRRVALGVMLCILSPILLILLGGAQSMGRIALTEGQAVGIGLVVLILLIGGAVALFVISGIHSSPFEYLEKEPIETLYGVDGLVRDRREKFRPTYARQLTVGIVLCVISAIPVFVTAIIGEESFWAVVSVGVLLALVAVGALLIVHCSVIWGSYQMLLEESDYSRETKIDRIRHGSISRIYWLAVTAGYLAWSFIGGRWDRSWIVWPIAGVAYGVVFGIVKALQKKDG